MGLLGDILQIPGEILKIPGAIIGAVEDEIFDDD